jgi:hypothetical protein
VNSNFFSETPKRHLLGWKRIVRTLNHGNRFTRLTCGGEQENNMKGKERKGKEGKERKGKEREGKGREGKGREGMEATKVLYFT